MIKLSSVVLKLGERELTFNEDLEFPSGSITFIKGESGAGKTTLLYILGMLSNQKQYQYEFKGKKINKQNQKEEIRKNEIGMLYQNFNVMEDLTLFQNLKLFADINSNELTEQIAKDLLQRFNLNIHLHRKFATLSGGEKQRFSLACVLLKNPSVIIADEPTSALDKGNADQLMNLLFDLALKDHKTVIISTHSNDYDTFADNIITLYRNQVVQTNPLKTNGKDLTTHNKKMNLAFYKDMIKYRLLRHFKNARIVNILMVLMLTLSAFLYNYVSSSEQEYMYYLNTSLKNETFMMPLEEAIGLSEEQISKIKQIPSINNIYPIPNLYGEFIIDGKSQGFVEVFPVYPFQSEITHQQCIVDNTFYQYIDHKATLTVANETLDLTIYDGYSLDRTGIFSSATLGKVFIPYDAISAFANAETTKYVLEVNNFMEYDTIVQKLGAIAPEYRLDSSYQYFYKLLLNARGQSAFIQFASVLLILTSAILFTTVTIHEVKDKQKEMCIFQANGLNKKHIFRLELMEYAMKFIIYFISSTILSFIFVFFANALILEDVQMALNGAYCIDILILLVTMFIMPGIVSSYYLLRKSPEEELRTYF